MGDISQKVESALWRRYYPEFGGWNEEWDEDDRWWVEVPQNPLRRDVARFRWITKERIRIGELAADSEDLEEAGRLIDEAYELSIQGLELMVRGPHNLKASGKPIESVRDLFAIVDAQALFEEVSTQVLMVAYGLKEVEQGNSDAPSGGDTGLDGADNPTEPSPETTPVSDASSTPAPTTALASTTHPQGGPTPSP